MEIDPIEAVREADALMKDHITKAIGRLQAFLERMEKGFDITPLSEARQFINMAFMTNSAINHFDLREAADDMK